MKLLILGMLLIASTAASADTIPSSPADVTDAQIQNYQFAIEAGCRDAGRRKGDPTDKVEAFCNCVMKALTESVTLDEWKQALFYSVRHEAQEEMRITAPHMQKLSVCQEAPSGRHE